jgi:hypothetical protein
MFIRTRKSHIYVSSREIYLILITNHRSTTIHLIKSFVELRILKINIEWELIHAKR